ncbi:hypothetical protein AB6A40_006561 [Gnathostoma spinigerum]|uniref:Uncharacterized protein n=1 Tax=Gnathostoma spinigerum TaxID=75299 RepID=A0ABD6ETH9_9BILA
MGQSENKEFEESDHARTTIVESRTPLIIKTNEELLKNSGENSHDKINDDHPTKATEIDPDIRTSKVEDFGSFKGASVFFVEHEHMK